ncbi:MAG: hypothetical protein R3B90_11365 [Planctomycetaceae bacterium]
MPKLFLGNFDFEHTLAAGPKAATPSSRLRRLCDELAFAWLGQCGPDDAILCDAPPPPEFLEELSARLGTPLPRLLTAGEVRPGMTAEPWGWTEAISRRAITLGCTLAERPAFASVRVANSRQFSLLQEQRRNCGLAGAAAAESIAELTDALRRLADTRGPADEWVIKANYCNSSRERLRSRGTELTERQVRWVRQRLAAGQAVVLEPWVEIVAEAGLQWEIPRTGTPVLIGVVPQIMDGAGHYRGSQFVTDRNSAVDWRAAINVTSEVAADLQRGGYFGPVGIDACWYRDDDGELRPRPLQDINARWSMGRLALGWRRHFPDARQATWHCGGQPESAQVSNPDGANTHSRQIIATTPAFLAGAPIELRQWIELAGSAGFGTPPSGLPRTTDTPEVCNDFEPS